MDIQKQLNRRDFFKVAGAAGLASMAFAGGMTSPTFASARTSAANPAITDLFFYDSSIGRGEFYGTDGLGHINHLRTYSTLSKNLTQIFSGPFLFGSPYDGMLFYDKAQGTGTLYAAGRDGSLDLINRQTGWRKTWTHIVNGHFTENGTINSNFDGLLFYEGSTGVSEFYSMDGVGHMQLLKHDIWSKGWTKIIGGPFAFNPSHRTTGLFFYNQAEGVGEFYGTDGFGGVYLLKRHAGLRRTWTTIITTPFGLLFYDASSGVSEFYRTDGQGGLHLQKHDTWSRGWTHIVSSEQFVVGSPVGGLLFYNSNTGTSAFYRYSDTKGSISLIHHDTWRKGWTSILENSVDQ